MPSFTQQQLKEAAQRRFTNNQLTGSSYNSGTYLVVDLTYDAAGTPAISVNPYVEVAVRDRTTSMHVAEEYGGHPFSRGDIQSGAADINAERLIGKGAEKTRRLLTVGAVVTLVDSEGNVGIPLHTRNGNVPLEGKVTNASGLASENPDVAMWNRINQESGFCHVDMTSKKIYVVILQPDVETRQANPTLSEQLSYSLMKRQHCIRAAVAKAIDNEEVRNTEKWNVMPLRIDSTLDFTPEQESSGMIQHVSLGGRTAAIPAHVHDDKARQTVTLTMPLRASVPFAFKDMIFIDPEGYHRTVKLHTEAEFRAIGDSEAAIISKHGEHQNDGVPALNSYVRRLNGRPETAPAPVVAAAPAPAPAPSAAA